jgi:putative phosphoribosyl transferase
MLFRNRVEAGRRLAAKLEHLRSENPIVVALPRGGVPVGYEIALALESPLDVLVARKIGAPGHPELGIGAVAEGGASYLDARTIDTLGVSREQIDRTAAHEQIELDRRVRAYRGDHPPIDVRGRTVVLVDDGLATGVTARAAVRALRSNEPSRIVFAAPVCAPQTSRAIESEVDEVVCAAQPAELYAVGIWYDDFTQTTDEQVIALLQRAARDAHDRAPEASAVWSSDAGPETGKRPRLEPLMPPANAGVAPGTVAIEGDDIVLEGALTVPEHAEGIVLFAHGSGSSRHSPRNRYVAGELERAGLATLLLDLLSPEEEALDQRTRHLRFDIALLARRIVRATDWLANAFPNLPVGYFGASTGAGAAIVAAAQRPERVQAIVSRGGRPDLGGAALPLVRAPTLLIVGGADLEVVQLNREAMAEMRGLVKLEIVPGATHLFEEPGALSRVAQLATGWLSSYLVAASRAPMAGTA